MKNNLLILILLVSTSIFAQENLIENNPSFKKSTIGWESGYWGDSKSTPIAEFKIDPKGHDDNACFKTLVKKNTIGGLGNRIFLKYTDLKLKKGKTYELTFWVKSFSGNDNIHVEIYSAPDSGGSYEWAATVNQNIPFTGNGKWQQVTKQFVVTNLFQNSKLDLKHMALLFGFDLRRGVYYIDNITLRKV